MMGECLSCIFVHNYINVTILGQMKSREQKHANYFRYSEGHRFHNERNCPYPIPNDLTEIDRWVNLRFVSTLFTDAICTYSCYI
jgi:hypothetical protein